MPDPEFEEVDREQREDLARWGASSSLEERLLAFDEMARLVEALQDVETARRARAAQDLEKERDAEALDALIARTEPAE